MKNTLYVGLANEIELPGADFLYINDTVPKFPKARIFDPTAHSFNPLARLDYRKASIIVEIFDALFDRGNSTLTKDTGLDFIAEALEKKPRFLYDLIPRPDKKDSTGHIWAYGKVQRILRSPILKTVLCRKPNFNLNRNSVILAKLDKSGIGRFDCLVLGLFLMAEFMGQIVVPDFGFYGRPLHTDLIEQGRLIAGVRRLSQIKDPDLRDECLLMEHKIGSHTTVADAKLLIDYEGTPENEQGARLLELIR
jgi:hypothetical protein